MDDEDVLWTVEMEVSLFHAMRKHKPVGVNRHFQMVVIHNRLNDALPRKISSKNIWRRLSKMYDLQALNESEIIPFPNSQAEFMLPDTEFKDVKEKSFPRMMKEGTSPVLDDSGKDGTKEHVKEVSKDQSKDGATIKGTKSAVTDKALERVADTSKSDDSPKREHRKRTRNTLQSPATDTPPSASSSKRARRT